jgi:preprotein translocase subunit SecG
VATDAASVVLASPLYFNGNATSSSATSTLPVVYFIESQGGVVRQYEAASGILQWTLDCGETSSGSSRESDNGCARVEADFTLARDGSMLYYGDVKGNLIAIQVTALTNTLAPTTAAPSLAASSVAPSTSPTGTAPVSRPTNHNSKVAGAPTARPTKAAPVPVVSPATAPKASRGQGFNQSATDQANGAAVAETNSSETSWRDSMLIYILAAVCGALLIMIVLVLCLLRRSRRYKSKASQNIGKGPVPTKDQGAVERMPVDLSTPKASHSVLADEQYGSSSLHNNSTPMTLQSIAESPDDEEQASVGFEVGMDQSIVPSESEAIVRDLDDAFSLVSQGDIEKGTMAVDGVTAPRPDLQAAYSLDSGSWSGGGGGRSMDSDDSASFLTRSMLAVASAVGVIASVPHNDEKKEDDSLVSRQPDQQDTDSEDSTKQLALDEPRVIRLSASGDQKSLCSRTSSGDQQILAQSPSGEQLIAWRSGSTDRSPNPLTNSQPAISRFAATTEQPISPLPSPTIVYPGMAKPPIESSASPLQQAPLSPNGSVLSLDGSLYMDEHTVHSLEMPLNEAMLTKSSEASAATDTAATLEPLEDLPSDCPEDEVSSKLRPGASYLSRHKAKLEQKVDENTGTVETIQRPHVHGGSNRTLPMYKGVSVRPASRSRAGLFSRRQPVVASASADTNESVETPESTEKVPLRSPEITSEPKRRNFSSVPTTPLSGTADAPSSPSSSYLPKSLESAPPSPASLPRFTTAGFYVEDETHKAETDESVFPGTDDGDESSFSAESEPNNYNPTGNTKGERPTTYDPWGSFLTELSKVESQFFNPTVAKKPKSRSLAQSRPPAPVPLPPDTVESDDDAQSQTPPPPPAPRTFYA